MGVKLYTLDASPPARAAMMALEIFNVPFEKIDVNLGEGQHLTPEYLKKNPMHAVPVLEDGNLILHDSRTILTYLADTYRKVDSWYPKDIKKRALVDQKLFFDSAILYTRGRNITYSLIMEGEKTKEQKHLDLIEEAYGFMEVFLSRTTYIAADHVTIADVSALSSMSSMVNLQKSDENKYPKTAAWYKKMKSTPYCKKYNDHGEKALLELVTKLLNS
uniref:Glutathione S-transferase n=1 Tax=Helicoverpa assulta TaxID=52344 RepID=A9UIB0_HELAU|nr:glutathione S-transferase [Helicoverpa assulta]ADP76648.1 glutathione S-transferase E1 [Helicoverpa assulta]